jgi:hypothetical protein
MALSIGASGVQLTLLKNNAEANRFTNRATERLATGLRINRASDDPAGLIGAEKLRGDLVEIGPQLKVVGAQRRQSTVQQSGRQAASSLLQEVRGLYVQAAGNTISTEEREAIQLQVDSSLDALDRLGATTGFALPASLDALRAGGSASAASGDPAAGAELMEAELTAINLASAAAGAYEKIHVGRRSAIGGRPSCGDRVCAEPNRRCRLCTGKFESCEKSNSYRSFHQNHGDGSKNPFGSDLIAVRVAVGHRISALLRFCASARGISSLAN